MQFLARDSRVDFSNQLTLGAWVTVTVSPPAGATGAIVEFRGLNSNLSCQGGARAVGSNADGVGAYQLGTYGAAEKVTFNLHYVPLTGNQFEAYSGGGISEAKVCAWAAATDITWANFEDFFTYITNGPLAAETWHTFDVSALRPAGATGVILRSKGSGKSGNAGWQFRRPGETEWMRHARLAIHATDFILPLDADGKTEVYWSHLGTTHYIVGFASADFTMYSTAPGQYSTSGSGWRTLTMVEPVSTAKGVVLQNTTDTASAIGRIQDVGQSQDGVLDNFYLGNQYVCALDAQKQIDYSDNDPNSRWMYLMGWWTENAAPTGPQIQDVNGNNAVLDKASFVINGTFPSTISTVTLGGVAVGIQSQDANTVITDAIDWRTGTQAYGDYPVVVSDGSNTDSKTVAVGLEVTSTGVTLAGTLLPDGVIKELAGAKVGDQIVLPNPVAGSAVTMTPDADVIFAPALPNETTMARWWFNGSVWAEDTITIYRGGATAPFWKGPLDPPDAAVGQDYEYIFGGLVGGDKPMVYSIASGALPPGFYLDQARESIRGVGQTPATFSGLSITADNSQVVLASNYGV